MAERPDAPRICVCVLMNHPFPANLPLLRRIYGGRFTALRFLIPFERLPDEDVITVYRGSYTHAAYLTDAHRELSRIDCDYYVVVHDDVLLTPRLTDASFHDYFPIGADDGFISGIAPVPWELGRWGWMFGLVPKLLFPKSQLFGSGIEAANLTRYLPAADRLREAMADCGIRHTSHVRFDPEFTPDPHASPSRMLLHGLAAPLDQSAPHQQRIDADSYEIERRLIATMLAAQRVPPTQRLGEQDSDLELPIPLVTAGYATDFYILPKTGFDDFCHYVGVAGAANLFVEIMAPSLLYGVCRRVWTAGELGLDFSGFDEVKRPEWLAEPRAVALHPFKMSALRNPSLRDDLLALLDEIAAGGPLDAARAAAFGFGTSLADHLPGWHQPEAWGVWSASAQAEIPIVMAAPGPVQIELLSSIDERLAGRLRYNAGRDVVGFATAAPRKRVVLALGLVVPDADGIARIALESDRLTSPAETDPNSGDRRMLGFGLVNLERVERSDRDLPAAGSAEAKPSWHDAEDWGLWSAAPDADIVVAHPRPGPLRLRLRMPLYGRVPELVARLEIAGGPMLAFRVGQADTDVVIDHVAPDMAGTVRIRLGSDRMVCPREVDAGFGDGRSLGFGLVDGRRDAAGHATLAAAPAR